MQMKVWSEWWHQFKTRQYNDRHNSTESLRRSLQLNAWNNRLVRPGYDNKNETWKGRKQRAACKNAINK